MRKRAEIQSFPSEKQYFDKRMSVLWQKSLPQCPFWYYNFNVGYFIPKKEKFFRRQQLDGRTHGAQYRCY